MTDHYDALGVPKDASKEEIKKAFRKKSKENHPDLGGDTQEMAKINNAFEVLSDPEKKDRYDKTGKDGNAPDPEQKARDLIRQFLSLYLDEEIEFMGNIVERIEAIIKEAEGKTKQAIKSCTGKIKKIERTKKRLKGPTFYEELLNWKQAQIEQNKAALEEELTVQDACRKILKEFSDSGTELDTSSEENVKKYLYSLIDLKGI